MKIRSITFLRRGLTEKLEAGAGYYYGVDKVLGSASYVLAEETTTFPSLLSGIGTRPTTETETGVYLSASKDLRPFTSLPLRAWGVLYRRVSGVEETLFGGGVGLSAFKNFYPTFQSYEPETYLSTVETDVHIPWHMRLGGWFMYLPDATDKTQFGFSLGYPLYDF